MTTPDDPCCFDELQRPAGKGKSPHDDASNFYQKSIVLETPLINFHATYDAIKLMKKIEYHTTSDMHSSCMTHCLRVKESSELWPGNAIPSTKEGLLWVTYNHR